MQAGSMSPWRYLGAPQAKKILWFSSGFMGYLPGRNCWTCRSVTVFSSNPQSCCRRFLFFSEKSLLWLLNVGVS
jgi:hypothetical protein